MLQNKQIAPTLKERILRVLEPLRPAAVYLFGSFGTDKERADSDLDLAVLLPRPSEPMSLFTVSQNLADELGREIDLVDLNSASTVMAKEVIRTGTLLADFSPVLRQQFEMRTLSDYARLNEERQPVLATFR